MDEKQRAELAALAEMMTSPGWDVMKRHTEEQIKQLKDSAISTVKTTEELYYVKGVLDTLERVVNHDRYVDALLAPPAEDPYG